MNLLRLISTGLALGLSLGMSLPASAQLTYNFSDSGNCNFPPANCTVTGTSTVAKNLNLSGWGASAGSNFAAATITDQSSSGIGINSDGNTVPNHAIDNNGKLELVLLNFTGNNVVLTQVNTGWSQQDTDISILRWTGGSGGPNMTSTLNFSNMNTTQLTAAGWSLVKSADLDSNQTSTNAASTVYGGGSTTTGLTVNAANSSSWWIVSAYFGATSGALDTGNDYFKLLSVAATCVSNTAGQACNNIATGTPVSEPGSMALAGLALAGLGYSRRRKKSI